MQKKKNDLSITYLYGFLVLNVNLFISFVSIQPSDI